jgi:hypothetical protein
MPVDVFSSEADPLESPAGNASSASVSRASVSPDAEQLILDPGLRSPPTMLTAEAESARMFPSVPLPEYTYYPGSGMPHPVRDPKGHSYGKKAPAGQGPRALCNDTWASNRHYLLGLDYFNQGFYWEAHEEWEKLWRVSGADTIVGRFLKGLIKLAAAGVKVRERSIHGVRRHAASAGEMFADVAAEADIEAFCGLEFIRLQFAADRAAQLAYKKAHAPGSAVRVFPFVLKPESAPLA